MKQKTMIVIFIIAALSGCSGRGSGEENNSGSTNPNSTSIPTITFTTTPIVSFTSSGSPAGNSVYFEKVSVNNDEITLAIRVQGGVDVYAASIVINFDGGKMGYVSASEGTYLNSDSTGTAFLKSYNNGELIIGITRKGAIPGVNGDGLLATVVLKALGVQVNTNIVFTSKNYLLNSNLVNISGITWLGWSLSYQ